MDRLLILFLFSLLAACGEPQAPATQSLRDPAIMGALSERLMSDPDLVGASRKATILTGGGLRDGGLPLFGPDDKEADRARAEAAEVLGGTVPHVPDPESGAEQSALARASTAASVAAAVPFAAKCAPKLTYSFGWAAQMPAAVPIYPRGQVQEAGGSDQAGCRLRVINFRTPVAISDVIDFYQAMGLQAGLEPKVARAGEDRIVSGAQAGLVFTVHARRSADGTTEVDLVTNG